MVTPLTVTAGWLRQYAAALGDGMEPHRARIEATRLSGISGKEFAHCRISTGTLTVPVSGGAGVLKRHGADPPLSEHGKWRREHLGAWNAAYGRTPYYIHLMPEIEGVYARSEGMTLEQFNSALLEVALGWLDTSVWVADTEGTDGSLTQAQRLGEVRAEARGRIDERLSIFDTIFRLGRYGVFAI